MTRSRFAFGAHLRPISAQSAFVERNQRSPGESSRSGPGKPGQSVGNEAMPLWQTWNLCFVAKSSKMANILTDNGGV